MMRTKFIPLAILFFVGFAMFSCINDIFPVHAQPAATSPVQCGKYFLYLHPSYWQHGNRQAQASATYKVFTVSVIPPDQKVDTLDSLWAYGVTQSVISMNRPVLHQFEKLPRADVRPATFGETFGDYINGSICMPYKPFELACTEISAFCGPK